MADILTLWVDCVNQINRNALSGYQGSDLGEFGGNVVHSWSYIHPDLGFLDYTHQLVKIRSSGRRKFRQTINVYLKMLTRDNFDLIFGTLNGMNVECID
jgi:hypothetical protein